MREMLVQPAKASLRVEPVNQHADVRGAECRPCGQPLMDATGTLRLLARSLDTEGGLWCVAVGQAGTRRREVTTRVHPRWCNASRPEPF